jgi:hypothetical protein
MSIGNFSQTYAEARGKFLAAADAAGLDSQAHVHPLLGRDGETLALDVVRDGPADAQAVLLVSSACHGVEGYCGSGVQVTLLQDAALRRAAQANGVAIVYLHALNPHGFSWWRRTTHENVDLNRNFQDFSQPLPRNTAYDSIAHLLVPAEWPPTPAVQQATQAWIATHGLPAWQAAVSAGQYHHPEGLFFGGLNPTWSHQAVRQVLRNHGQRCARLAWIDLHTGLGPSGVGERIFAGRDDAVAIARARAWWGGTGWQGHHVHLRRHLHIGPADRPDVGSRPAGVPAGRTHRHCAGIRHRAHHHRAGRAARRPMGREPPRTAGRPARPHPPAGARCVLHRHRCLEAAGAVPGCGSGTPGGGWFVCLQTAR